MTPKERFITALNLGIADRVPTFELEFQLTEELLGKRHLYEDELDGLPDSTIQQKLKGP